MAQFSMRGGLLLPVSGVQSRKVEFGEWDIIGENGVVTWVNRQTGESFSKSPELAISIATDLYNNILGTGVTNSKIACTREDYVVWERGLQAVVELAKEQQVVQARNVEKAYTKKYF